MVSQDMFGEESRVGTRGLILDQPDFTGTRGRG